MNEQETSPSTLFGRSLVFPSRLSHTRLFPKPLHFSYSYLLVGVSIAERSTSRKLVTVDGEHRGWLSVNGRDHLERGPESLNSKVNDYLLSQGHSRKEFPYIYLVCAPTFLGYQLNPASFWYFYDYGRTLQAVLIEVNNTFGERHLYWCPAQVESTTSATGGLCMRKNSSELKYRWSKDFHVSPFNSRKGGYSLCAVDPFSGTRKQCQLIDNRITLLSNHGRAKLVARARSTARPLDPSSLSSWGVIKLIMFWWWVGLATYPRILIQAGRLYFARKLHVWYRPEVRSTSICQAPNRDQRTIERFFRIYLLDKIGHLPLGTSLSYSVPFVPLHGPRHQCWPQHGTSSDDQTSLQIHVTSAAFFSRLIYYSSIVEALRAEGIDSREENRTVHVSNIEQVSRLLQSTDRDSSNSASPIYRWLLHKSRTSPPQKSYAESMQHEQKDRKYERHSSELDQTILSKCGPGDRFEYFWTALCLFAVKRVSDNLYSLFFLGGATIVPIVLRLLETKAACPC